MGVKYFISPSTLNNKDLAPPILLIELTPALTSTKSFNALFVSWYISKIIVLEQNILLILTCWVPSNFETPDVGMLYIFWIIFFVSGIEIQPEVKIQNIKTNLWYIAKLLVGLTLC